MSGWLAHWQPKHISGLRTEGDTNEYVFNKVKVYTGSLYITSAETILMVTKCVQLCLYFHVRKEQPCDCLCNNCDQGPEKHTQNVASLPDSLWDEEFHACCCWVTSSRPVPTQSSTKYTHSRSNRPVRRVFKIFPPITLLYIEEGGQKDG